MVLRVSRAFCGHAVESRVTEEAATATQLGSGGLDIIYGRKPKVTARPHRPFVSRLLVTSLAQPLQAEAHVCVCSDCPGNCSPLNVPFPRCHKHFSLS